MRSLRILLLLATSVVANEETNNHDQNYSQTVLPIDYFDDIFNHDLKVNQDTTFSFNFEQTRRDQPSQIEMREENVGKYVNARPQTTIPPTISSMNAHTEFQHPKPVSRDSHHQQVQGYGQQVPSLPPPPKFAFTRQQSNPHEELPKHSPSWKRPADYQYKPKNLNNVPRIPTPYPGQWPKLPQPQSTPSPHIPSVNQKSVDEFQFSIPSSIDFHVSHQEPTVPNRGTHKFNWGDVKKHEEVKPVMGLHPVPQESLNYKSSTPQSIHNKPPPPVPTLSPWYDNFGK